MLNPFRGAVERAQGAASRPSPFRPEAESALAGFRGVRAELERQVRRGDLTVKVARERAAEAASRMRDALIRQSEGYSPAPRAFVDRLNEAAEARARARESASLEALQRETNRLLRLSLVEQQLRNRSAEFEARAFRRPIAGGVPTPTLDGLLAFHDSARDSGDDAAQEWARRQLEAFRPRVAEPGDVARIDRACHRADRVSDRAVERIVEALRGRPEAEVEAFVGRALADRDASACVAAFLLARDEPEGPRVGWVRRVLAAVAEFPDAALAGLREFEAGARAAESEAARAAADSAIASAEAEARLDGLEPPTEADLRRAGRVASKPVARPGEAIGLALDRRGVMAGESVAETGEGSED